MNICSILLCEKNLKEVIYKAAPSLKKTESFSANVVYFAK
jgi:hypothetical protein